MDVKVAVPASAPPAARLEVDPEAAREYLAAGRALAERDGVLGELDAQPPFVPRRRAPRRARAPRGSSPRALRRARSEPRRARGDARRGGRRARARARAAGSRASPRSWRRSQARAGRRCRPRRASGCGSARSSSRPSSACATKARLHQELALGRRPPRRDRGARAAAQPPRAVPQTARGRRAGRAAASGAASSSCSRSFARETNTARLEGRATRPSRTGRRAQDRARRGGCCARQGRDRRARSPRRSGSNVGYGNLVSAVRVIAIVSPQSSPMRRLREEAGGRGKLVDATQGRRTRSILVTDSDHVILSALNPETIAARLEQTDGGRGPGRVSMGRARHPVRRVGAVRDGQDDGLQGARRLRPRPPLLDLAHDAPHRARGEQEGRRLLLRRPRALHRARRAGRVPRARGVRRQPVRHEPCALEGPLAAGQDSCSRSRCRARARCARGRPDARLVFLLLHP